MVSRSLVLFTVLMIFFIEIERIELIRFDSSNSPIPSIDGRKASQWLSENPSPRRWRQKQNNPKDGGVHRKLKQLQNLNDNGLHQHDTHSFEGVPMEVIFEMVYKKQNQRSPV